MNVIDLIFGKKIDEAEFMLDLDLIEESSKSVVLKRTAIESILGQIARDIAKSNVLVKNDGKHVKDTLFYRLNVMPNQNQSKNEFIYEIVMKMLRDGECLVVKSDSNDLLVADSYDRDKKAVYEDVFRNVVVNDFRFERAFPRSDVLYFKYSNESLDNFMNSLYSDYGELLGRMIEFQMKKSQIRASLMFDSIFQKDKKANEKLQTFIDRITKSIRDKTVAVFPLQKGIEYEEYSRETGTLESVDEIKKLKNQYLHEVAKATGYPIAFLNGEIADIEKITKNYYRLCLDPIISIIENEMNKQLFTSNEYLGGKEITITRPTTKDVFDLLRSGAVSGNELREHVNLPQSDDEMLNDYFVSKDYKEIVSEGGENE